MKTNDKWKIYSDAELFTMLSGTQLEIDGSFHELYRRYSVRIYGYCRRMVGDGAAEDVCQDIFLSFCWGDDYTLGDEMPPMTCDL